MPALSCVGEEAMCREVPVKCLLTLLSALVVPYNMLLSIVLNSFIWRMLFCLFFLYENVENFNFQNAEY